MKRKKLHDSKETPCNEEIITQTCVANCMFIKLSKIKFEDFRGFTQYILGLAICNE